MDTRLSDIQIVRCLCETSFRTHRVLCNLLILGLTLFSIHSIGDDVVGTYRIYQVDRESGEISKSEGINSRISISKEDDGSYAAVATSEVSKETWEKAQAVLKDVFEGLSPDVKKSVEGYGALICGVKPSETEGMFDKAADHIVNEEYKYENLAKTVETALEVIVDGNNVTILFPFPEGARTTPQNSDGEQEVWTTYEIVIENGELNGKIIDSLGPDLPSSRVCVGKRGQ